MLKRSGIILILSLQHALGVAHAKDEAPSSRNELAPPAAIIELMKTDDAEAHLRAFALWHEWRHELTPEQRSLANRYIAREEWFDVLANEVVYDFESGRRRLSGFKLLRRLGGTRRFPYFLWGVGDPDRLMLEPVLHPLGKWLNQSLYIKSFFKKCGDPNVLQYLPEFGWWDVRTAINKRWRDKEVPEPNWTAIRVEDFVADLSHESAKRRRLAIRALTANARSGGIAVDRRFHGLLQDEDESVRVVAATALTVTKCSEARGLLQRLAENRKSSHKLRRQCLLAIVKCGKPRRWSAEWMLDNLPDWPLETDETVRECLVKLCPDRDNPDRDAYESSLRRRGRMVKDPRLKKVIEQALKDLM